MIGSKGMKSFFKKTAISMLVIGMTSSVFAMPRNSNNWSTHLTGAFIGIEALDLRPENGDLDYVTSSPITFGQPVFTQAISPGYDWSWRLYGGIHFTDSDDITLSWMRMNTSDSSSVNPIGEAAPIWLDTTDWDNVNARVTFNLNDVYGVWGHTVHFNNPWSVRFAGGLEYARLHSDLTVAGAVFNGEFHEFEAESHLKGFGPRVEFDMTYHLPYGFALFGNTNAALLVSRRNVSIAPTGVFTDTFVGFDSNFTTRHIVVPKLGMRLGLSYTTMFGQAGGEGSCGSSLTLDAGWQAESYIHAIERPSEAFGEDVGTKQSTGISGLTGTKVSNFGNQGLFLGLKFSTDWM